MGLPSHSCQDRGPGSFKCTPKKYSPPKLFNYLLSLVYLSQPISNQLQIAPRTSQLQMFPQNLPGDSFKDRQLQRQLQRQPRVVQPHKLLQLLPVHPSPQKAR